MRTKEKYEDAKYFCENLGGNLTVIKNKKERDLIGINLGQVILWFSFIRSDDNLNEQFNRKQSKLE